MDLLLVASNSFNSSSSQAPHLHSNSLKAPLPRNCKLKLPSNLLKHLRLTPQPMKLQTSLLLLPKQFLPLRHPTKPRLVPKITAELFQRFLCQA
jgi:hypothetical protein